MAQSFVTFNSHPGIACSFRVQREQKRFAGTEVRLAIAFVVFEVAFEPARWAVRTEYLNTIVHFKSYMESKEYAWSVYVG